MGVSKVDEICHYLNVNGRHDYARVVRDMSYAIRDIDKLLHSIPEPEVDKFEEATNKWRDGDRSPEVTEILVLEGFNEYLEGDGSEYDSAVNGLLSNIEHKKTLSKGNLQILQDMYEYLEGVNFHNNLEAIELYTGVAYIP